MEVVRARDWKTLKVFKTDWLTSRRTRASERLDGTRSLFHAKICIWIGLISIILLHIESTIAFREAIGLVLILSLPAHSLMRQRLSILNHSLSSVAGIFR